MDKLVVCGVSRRIILFQAFITELLRISPCDLEDPIIQIINERNFFLRSGPQSMGTWSR